MKKGLGVAYSMKSKAKKMAAGGEVNSEDTGGNGVSDSQPKNPPKGLIGSDSLDPRTTPQRLRGKILGTMKFPDEQFNIQELAKGGMVEAIMKRMAYGGMIENEDPGVVADEDEQDKLSEDMETPFHDDMEVDDMFAAEEAPELKKKNMMSSIMNKVRMKHMDR